MTSIVLDLTSNFMVDTLENATGHAGGVDCDGRQKQIGCLLIG